jgi:hypothetical protein
MVSHTMGHLVGRRLQLYDWLQDREGQHEAGAAGRSTSNRNAPVMRIHDIPTNGEAKPEADT